MSGRRMQVGREEILSAKMRAFRSIAVGDTEIRRPRDMGVGKFWCIADAPPTYPGDFETRPVYRTKVPPGAECETCGISLQELADALAELASGQAPGGGT